MFNHNRSMNIPTFKDEPLRPGTTHISERVEELPKHD